jgi:hypothetical protein
MSRHTEKPIQIESYVASGTVTIRRFIKATGAQCDTKGEKAVGVARDSAIDGDMLPVTTIGTALVDAGEALALDAQVTTNALGKAVLALKGEYVNGIVRRAQTISGEPVEIALGGALLSTLPTTTTTTTTTSTTTTTTTA